MGRLGQVGLLRRYGDYDRKKTLEALKIVDMLDYKNRTIGVSQVVRDRGFS